MFMPGTPQIWYLDLFAGVNDYDAVDRYGEGGHKEINRTNLSPEIIESRLSSHIVQAQLEMIRFRNHAIAFSGEMTLLELSEHEFEIHWHKGHDEASLKINLRKLKYTIEGELDGKKIFLQN